MDLMGSLLGGHSCPHPTQSVPLGYTMTSREDQHQHAAARRCRYDLAFRESYNPTGPTESFNRSWSAQGKMSITSNLVKLDLLLNLSHHNPAQTRTLRPAKITTTTFYAVQDTYLGGSSERRSTCPESVGWELAIRTFPSMIM